MALTQVTGPYPIFTDLDGSPLDDGYLYIGEINQDPEANPIQVYWDANLTIPASQPIRTNSGYAWRNGTPGLIYTGSQFSITIRNKKQEFVLYSPVGYGFDPAAVSASVVKNDYTGDGVEVAFTLSASPSTKLATNVFINGVYQEKDSYSLSGNVITFSVAPPISSSIEIMTNETGVINSGNATAISYTAGFPGATLQTVQTKLEQYVSVKDFIPLGTDTETTDCAPYFQAAIDYCMKQYDPSETTQNGNDVTYMGEQKTLWIPVGRYSIGSTLNMSFRNQIEMVGEDQWNSILWWTGAVDGMVIDARCSSYVTFRNFTIDGNFNAQTFIYCAGNGNNAPGSKGNVTGNYFGHLYFWNQKGNLTPPYVDYTDQYDPLTAMLNTITVDTSATYYNSMDDSVIEFCRFAPNSLNNSFCIGISSSANVIRECQFFAANGVLCYNGAQFWMSNCIASNYAPETQDSQHNHALLKFNYNSGGGGRFTDIELHHCYMESLDYYGNGNSAKLAYWAQGNVVNPEDEGVLNLLVNGGLYSGTAIATNYTYIDIQERRRANIKLINATVQGVSKLYVYTPDSAVEINDQSFSLTGFPLDTQTWQVSAYQSLRHKYQTPEFQVEGASVPAVNVTVGTTDYPGQLKFLSLDEALAFVSDCKGAVSIFLDQNDTVTRGGTINGNVAIALQGFTLDINASLVNRGNLTIRNSFANNTRGGTVASTTKYLSNLGNLTIQDCYVDNVVENDNGTVSLFNVEFSGTASSVLNNNAGKVVVDSDTCTFSGSGYVVDLGPKYGDAVLKSAAGSTPSTGLWMRGTRLEFTNPALGFPNQYWATANGIGSSANWGDSGNLT